MWYPLTPELQTIVSEFRRVASEITSQHLDAISAAARAEWRRFVQQWPSDDELRGGLVKLSLDDLSWMLARARRFHSLVQGGRGPAEAELGVGALMEGRRR